MVKLAWSQFDGATTLMWRAQQLHEAGLDEALAASLAIQPTIDLHRAVDAIRGGLRDGHDQSFLYHLLSEDD